MDVFLTLQDYKKMPWKNGLGMTSELAVCHHDDHIKDSPFLWRISIAGVAEDGPFSIFPNIDRNIMLLEGEGISLDGGDAGHYELSELHKFISFAGDIDVFGRLYGGDILDLNVMHDRRYFKTKVDVIEGGNLNLTGDVNFIHILEKAQAIDANINGNDKVFKSGDSYIGNGKQVIDFKGKSIIVLAQFFKL
ncbi:MAG: HutD family protein [Emcibacteraceae bacterium]|nr:HutD family protein [Emcibacteraceae bacterium]